MTILADLRASQIGAGPWSGYLLGPWSETSWWAPDNNPVPARAPRRCTLVQDPLGQRGQVIRSELLAGDGPAITSLPDSHRSELGHTAVLLSHPNTYWISWSSLLLSPWVPDTDCPTTIWQLHDTLDAGDAGRRPVLEMEVSGDSVVLINGFTHADGNEAVNTPSHPQPYRQLIHMPLAGMLGAWQDWVLRITMSRTDGAGQITLWRNRRRIFTDAVAGPRNCGTDVLGSYVLTGVYCPVNWPIAGVASRVAYSTGMRIGDAAETFASMAGASELESVTPSRLALS